MATRTATRETKGKNSGQTSKKGTDKAYAEGDLKGKKLVFITDKDEAFRDFTSMLAAKNLFGFKGLYEAKVLKDFTRFYGKSIFDDTLPLQVIDLDSKDLLDKAYDYFSSNEAKTIERNIAGGLIMRSSLTKAQLRKFLKLLEERGVLVKTPPAVGKNESVAGKILSTTYFSSEIKRFLQEYVGNDYNSLYPILSTFSSKAKQAAASLQDIEMSIPSREGYRDAWGIEKSIYSGDAERALEIFYRTDPKAFVLTLWVIRKKTYDLLLAKTLLAENRNLSKEDYARSRGSKTAGWGEEITIREAKKHNLETLTEAFELIQSYDSRIRGVTSLEATDLIVELIRRLSVIFKRGT